MQVFAEDVLLRVAAKEAFDDMPDSGIVALTPTTRD